MKEYAITTEDNPIDPFEDPYMWWLWDTVYLGYNTSSLLARFAHTSGALTDPENNEIISDAIDRIIAMHHDGFYKKLTREVSTEEYLRSIGA